MASNVQPQHADQSFAEGERLFRRVRRDNLKRDGKPTLLAFDLPDMSVQREQFATDEDARKGFNVGDWGVVAFLVRDIPPREAWTHIAQVYSLLPRHVPLTGNFPHSEVRVRRLVNADFVLITHRSQADFDGADPDAMMPRGLPDALLDPDFHMRWRKHIAMASKPVLLPLDKQP